jgi:diguanylate cyclase (GGDEF)-like protein
MTRGGLMKAQGNITTLTRSLASTATVRLAGLHKMAIFYTPLEERFERLSRLGKQAMGVRVAAVSLIAGEKQWFKSVVGWRVTELPLADSLCLAVVESGEPLIVYDTHDDPRFASSRLVKSGPKFRFYAGYPIRDSDGLLIGTYCVFDVHPKKPDPTLLETLLDLGQLAERELVTADLWDAQGQLVAKLGEARRQALLDTLTRVWNRRGGTELLEMMLERSRKSFEQFSLCIVDIDHFKDLNDTNGHTFGDQVLRKTAASIVGSVRPEDIVSRYGGDEFLLILRDAGEDIARQVAARIRDNLARTPLPVRDGFARVTLSIGIAVNDPAEDIASEQMIDRADQALFHTKRNGRDGVTLYPDDIG